MDDLLQLGGNIELAGFRELDSGTMIILKKIIGSYARKFAEQRKDFQKLHLAIKTDSPAAKFELHCKLLANGQTYISELADSNVFFLVDSALKRVEADSQQAV